MLSGARTSPGTTDGRPDEAARTVEQIAEHLREDPVLVHQVLGNGATAEVDAALTTLAEEAGLPVYVVLVQAPAGLSQSNPTADLAVRLDSALDRPGVFVVGMPGQVLEVAAYDLPMSSGEASWVRHEALGQLYDVFPRRDDGNGTTVTLGDAGEAAVLLTSLRDGAPLSEAQVADLSTDTLWVEQRPEYAPTGPGGLEEPFTDVVAGVAVAVALLPAVWLFLRGRHRALALPATKGAGSSAGRRPTDVGELRSTQQDLRRLAAAAALDESGSPRSDLARRCADEGDLLLAEAEEDAHRRAGPVDPVALAGAQVLVLAGKAALAGSAPYHPCFVDPGHGAGERIARIGAGDVGVPACARCSARADQGEAPLPLRRLEGGRRRHRAPYWEVDDVWTRTGMGSLTDDLPAALAAARHDAEAGR